MVKYIKANSYFVVLLDIFFSLLKKTTFSAYCRVIYLVFFTCCIFLLIRVFLKVDCSLILHDTRICTCRSVRVQLWKGIVIIMSQNCYHISWWGFFLVNNLSCLHLLRKHLDLNLYSYLQWQLLHWVMYEKSSVFLCSLPYF